MRNQDDPVRHIVIPARAEHAGIIFETVAEAQTSSDPTKLTKAVEKFAAETRRESDLGFACGSYACALCAAHDANRLSRLKPAV